MAGAWRGNDHTGTETIVLADIVRQALDLDSETLDAEVQLDIEEAL